MPKATAETAPSDKLALYEKLVATNPKVERKGATVPYTSLNGHMFSYLSKDYKLALRLPPADRETFLKKYKARLCEAYGKVQPEYVEVPDSLLASTQELKKFFVPATPTSPRSNPSPPRKRSPDQGPKTPVTQFTILLLQEMQSVPKRWLRLGAPCC